MSKLEPILSLAAYRVRRAEQLLAAATDELKRTALEEERARIVLSEHQCTAALREAEIYAELIGNVVSQDKLESFRAFLTEQRRKEARLATIVAGAAENAEVAARKVEDARSVLRKTTVTMEKYSAAVDASLHAATVEAAYREEHELEDISGARK